MFFKTYRDAKRARRRYELATLESLIDQLNVERKEREQIKECPICAAWESPEKRAECQAEMGAPA